jgi:uncharacterized protein (TIGR03435 family)
MNRVALPLLALLAGSGGAYAQQAAKLEFEVASVKLSPPSAGSGTRVVMGCRGGPGTNDPALFVCGNINLTSLVDMAYNVPYYAMSAPDWLITTYFEIRAVVPEGISKDQFATMLQNLLADRFKLVAHRETREIQRYELTVAKGGPKFKEAVPPPAKGDSKAAAPSFPIPQDKDGYPILRGGMSMAVMGDKARASWHDVSMAMLANQLSNQLHGPMTDATGLTGKYDIDIYWSADTGLRADAPGADPARDPSGPTLQQAVQEQLGLRVESKKGPVDFLVVDHAEKVPTEN